MSAITSNNTSMKNTNTTGTNIGMSTGIWTAWTFGSSKGKTITFIKMLLFSFLSLVKYFHYDNERYMIHYFAYLDCKDHRMDIRESALLKNDNTFQKLLGLVLQSQDPNPQTLKGIFTDRLSGINNIFRTRDIQIFIVFINCNIYRGKIILVATSRMEI